MKAIGDTLEAIKALEEYKGPAIFLGNPPWGILGGGGIFRGGQKTKSQVY